MLSWNAFPAAFIALSLCALAPAQARDGPLVITKGGTYHGDWASDDPARPVIRISTKEPVIIEHSSLTGRGNLICADAGSADVTVRDVHGVALNPNVAGKSPGRFFTGDELARLVIEHCQLDGTAGIYVHRTSASVANAEITIRFNDVRNIDGRHSDGHDGYAAFNRRTRVSDKRVEEGFDLVQFVQLDQVVSLPKGEIAWNRVINEPGRSRVEDVISIYRSSGRPDSPIRIHDNCIVGAYSVAPWQSNQARDGWQEDWEYSGGGIMLGDGPGESIDHASGYVIANDNVVISTGNYGIAAAAGHHLSIVDNRLFASGQLADGRLVRTQNVGIYVWDTHHGKRRQPPTFFDNMGSGNVVGWFDSVNGKRNDWWSPDAAAWSNNVHAAGPVTNADEIRESQAWLDRAKAANIAPGLHSPSVPSTGPEK